VKQILISSVFQLVITLEEITFCVSVTYIYALSRKENESFHDLEDIVSNRFTRTAYILKNTPVNTPDTCTPSNVNDDFIFWP